MTDISFVGLSEHHVDSCWQLYRELESHYEHPIGGNWTREKIAEEIREHFGLAACQRDGEVEAFCLYRQYPDRKEIMLVATRPRFHRTGAMRSLIRSLLENIPDEESVWLEVHAGNLPAIGLYESLGFELSGERPGYYSDGGKALVYQFKRLR